MGGPLSVVKVFTPIWTSQVHSLLLESSANFVSYSSYWCLVGNGWAWGLLGWLLIVIMDHSRKFPAFSTSKSYGPYYFATKKTSRAAGLPRNPQVPERRADVRRPSDREWSPETWVAIRTGGTGGTELAWNISEVHGNGFPKQVSEPVLNGGFSITI